MFDDAAFSVTAFDDRAWLMSVAALVATLSNILRIRVNLDPALTTVLDNPTTIRTTP